MSDRAPLSTERRRTRPALVIDGEATVIAQRTATTRPESDERARRTESESAPDTAFRPHAESPSRAAFGRRPTQRRPSPPDLVFQGSARRANEPAPRKAARRGLAVFTDGDDLLPRAGERRVAGFAVLAALLALPAFILSAPVGPAEATPGADALVIEQLVTSIVPRGAGAVLSVEGRIRNVSGRIAAIPPLRIALAEPDGDLRSKSLVTGVSSLSAGHSVRFHSAVAVAKDSRGDIMVGFLPPPLQAGKTLIE